MNRYHEAIEKANGKPLLGTACYFYDPIFIELSAELGFKVMWVEMEHAGISFAQAADLCRLASAFGMLTMIRIPDARRESVIKAADCGPDMIDVPMADTPEIWRDLYKYAKYPPEGARGLWTGSRSLHYSLPEDMGAAVRKANEEIALMAQIETVEAMGRLDELAAIPGVDLFFGPADYSACVGVPWQTGHATVMEAAAKVIAAARKHGKKVATACPPADFAKWIEMGVDLLYVANDISCLRVGAKNALKAATDAVADAGK